MTPDGQFFEVAGNIPWPLYGDLLPAGFQQFTGPDNLTIRTEENNQHVVPCVSEECAPGDHGDD